MSLAVHPSSGKKRRSPARSFHGEPGSEPGLHIARSEWLFARRTEEFQSSLMPAAGMQDRRGPLLGQPEAAPFFAPGFQSEQHRKQVQPFRRQPVFISNRPPAVLFPCENPVRLEPPQARRQ